MKKNKRLLYNMENLPDKYLEEVFENPVKKSRIHWKSAVLSAACVMLVFSIPVLMKKNSVKPDIPQESRVSNDTSCIQKTVNDVSGEMKVYIPDEDLLDWSVCSKEPKEFVYKYSDTNGYVKDGYYQVNFLKDKKFESQINEEIKEASDRLRTHYKDEYLAAAEESTYPETVDPSETSGIIVVPGVKNGYLEIILGYETPGTKNDFTCRNYDYLEMIRYDLVSQKKIESFSDYFIEGADQKKLLDIFDTVGCSGNALNPVDMKGYYPDEKLSGEDAVIFKNDEGKFRMIWSEWVDNFDKISNYLKPEELLDYSDILENVTPEESKIDVYRNVKCELSIDGNIGYAVILGPNCYMTEKEIREKNAEELKIYEAAFRYYLSDKQEKITDCILYIMDNTDDNFRCRNVFENPDVCLQNESKFERSMAEVNIVSGLNAENSENVFIDTDSYKGLGNRTDFFTEKGKEYVINYILENEIYKRPEDHSPENTTQKGSDKQNREEAEKYFNEVYWGEWENVSSAEGYASFFGFYHNDTMASAWIDVPFEMINEKYFDIEKYKEEQAKQKNDKQKK